MTEAFRMGCFTGQGVVVTGGASGLGRAGARAFAELGARVAIVDRDIDAGTASAHDLGDGHLFLSCDVTNAEVVAATVDRALESLGRIDVLINCAGIPDAFVATLEQDADAFRRVVDVHLTGSYLTCKAVAPHMLARGSGAIVNMSSMAGVLGLAPRNAYSAAKAGIQTMTRTLACEWASGGVRVNALAPGYLLTPFFETLMAEGKLDGAAVCRRTPMGRFGTAGDAANAMLFLASAAARFITGVTLPIDGGYSAFGGTGHAYDGPLD